MRICSSIALLSFAVALSLSAFAAGRDGPAPAVKQGRGALATPGVRALAAPGGPGFVPAVQQGRGALATSGVRALAASGGPGFVPASQQGRGALATSEVRSLAAPGGPGFVPAVQQGRGALATSGVRALAAPADAKDDMARYSLKAYENRDEANRVRAMLFTPKTVGMNALPMEVYLPGCGGRDEARPSRNNPSGSGPK